MSKKKVTEAKNKDMMEDPENQNGVLVFKKLLPPYPKGLKTNFKVVSPFGFKIIELEGEEVWAAGTEEDYRKAEAKRLKIKPEEVKIPKEKATFRGCIQTGPTSCSGSCAYPGFCRRIYNPAGKYYYCGCVY
jgi:hypothetical protein